MSTSTVTMESKNGTETVAQKIKKNRRKRAQKNNQKKNQQSPVDESTLPSIQSVNTNTPSPSVPTQPPVNEKMTRLRQKLGQLKAKRTGVERRQQVSAYKEAQEAQGKKPKNAMRNIAREGIHELMGKLGIQDDKIESEIMNEIVRGKLQTPTQVAEYVVQKLQQRFPNGPKSVKPSQPPINADVKPSQPPPPVVTTQSEPTQSSRKPLRHPNPSLMVRPKDS